MKKIRLLMLFSILFLTTDIAIATDYYVRDRATGANNGTDWNNAYTTLPATLVRGGTYYIASGSYPGYTFDDPVSGPTFITIKKATIADHGTATGWSDNYGTGQAIFGACTFNTGYYVVDGKTGGGPPEWTANLGIKINKINSRGTFKSNLIFKHIDIDGGATTSNGSRPVDIGPVDNITFSYCYIHNAGDDVMTMVNVSNLTVEYSKCAYAYESASYHPDLAQGYGGPYSNLIWRFNYIYDVDATYLWGVHDGNTATTYEIYGNIIVFTPRSNTSDGIVGNLNAAGIINNLKFYNNTITGDFNYNVGFGTVGIPGSNNVASNNIWVRLSGSGGHGSINSVTHNYNSAYNFTALNLSGTGEYNNKSGNIFVDSAAGNYSITAPTEPGIILGSPYNVDMYGNIRGADGAWDRGAIEYGPGNLPSAPSKPNNLTIVTP